MTHRDPVKTMTSYASLTALVRSLGSQTVDPKEIARDWTARIKRVLEHAIDVRQRPVAAKAQFYDMHFQDFVTDQFATVEKIYRAFALPLSDEAAGSPSGDGRWDGVALAMYVRNDVFAASRR